MQSDGMGPWTVTESRSSRPDFDVTVDAVGQFGGLIAWLCFKVEPARFLPLPASPPAAAGLRVSTGRSL